MIPFLALVRKDLKLFFNDRKAVIVGLLVPIVLASFGQGSNSIKSAEQGAGLGLPIAKNLVDMHGGTFTLKSKVRIGTELIATFPPERVMAALPPLAEPAPSIQPPETPEPEPAPFRQTTRSILQRLRG